ncbi:MAG TPA: hypothetical protein VK436_16625 [Methanocella sp.]|nr:hypothetical protein [Methanocella sp.]
MAVFSSVNYHPPWPVIFKLLGAYCTTAVMQVDLDMGFDNRAARICTILLSAGVKLLPLFVLLMMLCWILLILMVLGLNTTVFQAFSDGP